MHNKVFITGTDTGVGKTLVSAWLCMHMGYRYFKPIQTGTERDSLKIDELVGQKVSYDETYLYAAPVSPHLAAALEKRPINMKAIILPTTQNLVVEGAGGIFVPICDKFMMIDLMVHFQLPVLLVARPGLGTINHTLLSLEALRHKGLEVLGVIMSGMENQDNKAAIEKYGKIRVLAQVPHIDSTREEESLKALPLPTILTQIFEV
jgi:dethiobiotin synthetase